MAWSIFGQLDWLTTRVKRLCCAVDKIKESGVGNYKVFTALLTALDDNTNYNVNTGTLTIGVTYYIINDSPGMDFTNVGAPNNNLGTFFIATGTTPNSWGTLEGIQAAILLYNGATPVVTILENTIGSIWFNRQSTGLYEIGSNNGAFTADKTYTNLQVWGNSSTSPKFGTIQYNAPSLLTMTLLDSTFNLIDGIGPGYITSIEIRVYN